MTWSVSGLRGAMSTCCSTVQEWHTHSLLLPSLFLCVPEPRCYDILCALSCSQSSHNWNYSLFLNKLNLIRTDKGNPHFFMLVMYLFLTFWQLKNATLGPRVSYLSARHFNTAQVPSHYLLQAPQVRLNVAFWAFKTTVSEKL